MVGEAAALLLLLSERHPDAGLVAIGPGAPDRPRFLEGMFFLANTVQPLYRRWFYPGDAGPPEREAEIKDNTRQALEAAWDRIDGRLAGGGFMAGDYSVLDMHTTMLCRWSRNMPKPSRDPVAAHRSLHRQDHRPAVLDPSASRRRAGDLAAESLTPQPSQVLGSQP